jgi:hypothetical protein
MNQDAPHLTRGGKKCYNGRNTSKNIKRMIANFIIGWAFTFDGGKLMLLT